MEEWQVVAILDRSAGNDTVGEMWQETKVFDQKTPLFEVMKWAARQTRCSQIEDVRSRLQLTIAQ